MAKILKNNLFNINLLFQLVYAILLAFKEDFHFFLLILLQIVVAIVISLPEVLVKKNDLKQDSKRKVRRH